MRLAKQREHSSSSSYCQTSAWSDKRTTDRTDRTLQYGSARPWAGHGVCPVVVWWTYWEAVHAQSVWIAHISYHCNLTISTSSLSSVFKHLEMPKHDQTKIRRLEGRRACLYCKTKLSSVFRWPNVVSFKLTNRGRTGTDGCIPLHLYESFLVILQTALKLPFVLTTSLIWSDLTYILDCSHWAWASLHFLQHSDISLSKSSYLQYSRLRFRELNLEVFDRRQYILITHTQDKQMRDLNITTPNYINIMYVIATIGIFSIYAISYVVGENYQTERVGRNFRRISVSRWVSCGEIIKLECW